MAKVLGESKDCVEMNLITIEGDSIHWIMSLNSRVQGFLHEGAP